MKKKRNLNVIILKQHSTKQIKHEYEPCAFFKSMHGSFLSKNLKTMYFHGARFSNYEAWLSDPTHIKPSAQVVWPIVGQEILNGDVGGGFQGVQITSGFFQLWRASGITSELQLYATAIGGLVLAAACFFAGWFHYHKAAPKLEWFQNVESMLNHHLAGLLGLGSLGWAGHQIHVSLPINKLLDAGVDPKEIPLPHEFLLNKMIMADLFPSFAKGLAPFFTLNWIDYSDFLTFKGGLNPVTGGLWLSDTAHHHLAIAVLFLVAGHQYRTNWGIGHSIKEILEAHKGPFTGEGHVGLYEILTTSWHAQLAINLALFGSLSILVAHHMYSMPPYPYLATDYGTQLSIFTHHMWIGGFCIVGAGAHGAIFMVRDYDPTNNYNNLLDRVIRHRDAIISHLNWVCIFLGFHSFGLYIHNDTMSALGRPQDMFSDTAIQLQPVFAQWIQNTHFTAPLLTAPNALAATSLTWGGDVVAVGGKVAMMPISLGTADFLVWVMLDQVKFRYMLEQSACLFFKYQHASPYLNQVFPFCKFFLVGSHTFYL
uniref:Photosystem I P700 chlorophyll a apoprotein A1 n=2 Tax=Haematococcus lacustris TaxID=44745 RepID=A0A2K9YRZ4_HAELA|nr:photosystem I P700 chlorophyll a apoprotein A1 [Haematococcus lacustris]AUW36508.1 photosystem I P700 chlorophyll a apoprotein A1 [Haematococcus lacustris]